MELGLGLHNERFCFDASHGASGVGHSFRKRYRPWLFSFFQRIQLAYLG